MKTAYLKPTTVWIAAVILAACGDDSTAGAGDTGIALPTDSADDNGNDDLDGGSGSADGTADGADDLPGNCGASTFMLDHQPTNVVLVLDKSFSMVDNYWDSDNDQSSEPVTRWNSLHRSVSFIIDEFDEGLNFGAVLFPSVTVPDNEWETACLVGIEPDAPVAPNNGEMVMASLPPANDLDIYGGTPASEGVSTALNHLRSLDPELPRAMILITDGAANCLAGTSDQDVFDIYDENLPALVAEAYNAEDIPTYVVGIDIVNEIVDFPQDNPFERLNEVAIAGGFPQPGQEKFHNAADEEELRSAISQISSQIGCIIPLETPPEQPDLLSVFIAGDEVARVDSCEGTEEGWRYINPEGPYDEIELCANSCSALHNQGTLSAVLNCVPPG